MKEKEPSLSNEEIESIESGKKISHYENPSERTLDEYQDVFNFNKTELIGKKILDVGPSLKFQRQAKKHGIDVTGIDLSIRPDHIKDDSLIYGSGQFLAIKNESFDIVLANNSVPAHFEKGKDLEVLLSIYELLRVVKKNGEVRIHPFTPKEIFEKEGMIAYSNPETNPDAKIFTKFNLKELLEESNIFYEIKNIAKIDKWLGERKNWEKNGWEKAGLQFIELHKSGDFNPKPFINEIKRLIKEKENNK